MDVDQLPGSFALAIAVFLLVSCIYRKHIQRRAVFYWAMGLFIGGLIMIEASLSLHPDRYGAISTMAGRPQTWSVFDLSADVGRWIMYASLPVFVLACTGHSRAFAQCSRCGYDLTGNKSGVCPECGANLDENKASE